MVSIQNTSLTKLRERTSPIGEILSRRTYCYKKLYFGFNSRLSHFTKLLKNGYGAETEDMIVAIEDVRNEISFRGAAKKHKISKTNLCDGHYFKGKVQVAGRPTSFYLTKKN